MTAGSLGFRILIIAASGAVGAVARWATSRGTQVLLGTAWPWGTLAVNAVGCFVFGCAYEALRHTAPPNDVRRLIWLTGFCGAYTTFSTFAFDLIELHASRGLAAAAANVGLHLALGPAALVAGAAVGRLI